MDTSDPDIEFDEKGISNHWHNYAKRQQKIHVDEYYRDLQLKNLLKKLNFLGKIKSMIQL